MAMYEVGTVSGAVSQARVTGVTTKWSQTALGIQQGSILVVYRSGSTDLYAIKSVDSDTQLTLTRNITTAFSGASYGIITAETASTSSFANQLASAFTLWRNVVEGWSLALTGSGNITMTDPVTGASVTVPAISGMARLAGGNLLTGTQTITNDDAGFILGKNQDIGLVKKYGTHGKLMVGKSTRFSVVRSENDRISATDRQTEIFGVESNGDAKVANSLYVKGLVHTEYQFSGQSIELSDSTPYIDFHFGNSTADYTGRIIATAVDQLNVSGSHLWIERDLKVWGATYSNGDIITMRSGYGSNTGSLQSTASIRCRMNGRGAYSDRHGAWAGFYMEEVVGAEHRMVFMMDGFGKNVTMILRNDRSLEMDTIRLNNGRTRCWTGIEANYLEIYVDGMARGINFFNSDERLKENIRDIRPGAAANVIRQLRPVSYRFRDTEYSGGKAYSFGILAQEAEKVIPDLIQTMSDDTKSIDPLAAIGLLLAHNKELEARVSALEAKLHN